MQPNTTGRCPPEARGKRVRATLRNGYRFEAPADDPKQGPDWSLTDPRRPSAAFDIEFWELIE